MAVLFFYGTYMFVNLPSTKLNLYEWNPSQGKARKLSLKRNFYSNTCMLVVAWNALQIVAANEKLMFRFVSFL